MMDKGVWTVAPSEDATTPGGVTPGGYKIHFLRPRTTALHACVPLGSTWKLNS